MYYQDKFIVDYAFSLSAYLENKMKSKSEKWIILNKLFKRDNIQTFYFNSDPDYITNVFNWGFNPEKTNKQSKKNKT